MKGKLISFESGEGAGTSTHIKLLEEYLIEKGFEVIRTREPGGIELAELLRKEVQHPDKDHTAAGELLLYSTARYLHTKEKIKPALEAGKIVLTDRLHDSTTAYQGYAGGVDLDFCYKVHKAALGDIWPHLTIFIEVEPEIGLSKSDHSEFGRPDRMEAKDLTFHEKVRQGYIEIAKQEPERVRVITYRDGDIDGMQQEVRSYVNELLGVK